MSAAGVAMDILRNVLAKLRQQKALWTSWVIRFWVWLWMRPEITGTLLITGLVLTVAIIVPDCWEVMLELLGVGIVAWSLHHTRRLFEQPTLLEGVRGWLKKFPPLRRHVRLEAGAATFAVQGGRAYGSIAIKPRPGGPLDERVTSLEMNLNQVLRSVHELEKRFDVTAEVHASRLEGERKAREEGDKSAHDKIYQAVASGLHLERLGVAFLVFGILLATMSAELSALIGAVPCVASTASN